MDLVLVTGGAGYIGSHTVVELINRGFFVVVVDNLCNSSAASIDGIERITSVRPEFVEADCADYNQMAKVFASYPGIKAAIHFAALKAVGESVGKPLDYYRNNIVSLLNLLSLMGARGGDVVFSSSCTVYGQPDVLPVTEAAPYKPALSPYGNTKKIAEDILRDTVYTNDRLRVIALRYFNPIGAHPSAEIGELPLGKPDNLVPFITQTAAGIREKLQVFGNDYNTPDGTALRDYFHVTDLAKAHVAALRRMLDGRSKSRFEAFNVGAGNPVSVLDIVKTFEKVSGLKLNYELVGRREGDIEKVWADTSVAERELAWKVESSLEKALLSAWIWEKKLRGIK